MDKEPTDGVSIHAGFPNPAGDKSLGSLNINQLLVTHPASTFLFRLRGHEWDNLGIFDGDIAIVDRALDARNTDLVIWWQSSGDDFAISHLKDILPGANVWGVVTTTIHQFRRDSK